MSKCPECGFVGAEMHSPFVAHERGGVRCLTNQLASQAAEIERLKARLAQADEKLVGILGVVNDAILDRQIMESIDAAASDAGGKE